MRPGIAAAPHPPSAAGHRPAQEIPGPWGRGAGKDSHAILTLTPCLSPGWPQETGYGLGGSDSAHCATHGSKGVKSLALGCPPDPAPKISPNHPTGSTGTAPAPSRGLLQLPRPPSLPLVIAVFLPSSQPAHDSRTQLIRASLESP